MHVLGVSTNIVVDYNVGDESIVGPTVSKVKDHVLEEFTNVEDATNYMNECYEAEMTPLGLIPSNGCAIWNSTHPCCPPSPPSSGFLRTIRVVFRKGRHDNNSQL